VAICARALAVPPSTNPNSAIAITHLRFMYRLLSPATRQRLPSVHTCNDSHFAPLAGLCQGEKWPAIRKDLVRSKLATGRSRREPFSNTREVRCLERRRRLTDILLPIRSCFVRAAELDQQIPEVVQRLEVVRIRRDGAPPVFDRGHEVPVPRGDD